MTFHTDAMDEGALVPAPGDPPIVDAVGRGKFPILLNKINLNSE